MKASKSRYPRGKISTDDEGEIAFAVGSSVDKAKVCVSFKKPVAWLGMDPAGARELATMLEAHADRAEGRGIVAEVKLELEPEDTETFFLEVELSVLKQAVAKALSGAVRHGIYDDPHHKAWVIDQMVRVLTGCPEGENSKAYREFVAEAEEGPEAYSWSTGVAP